jgi:hypothetical protein
MDNEFFKYLIENQSKWEKMYKEQKKEEHQKKRIEYMKEYNKTYNRPLKGKKNKSYYILG